MGTQLRKESCLFNFYHLFNPICCGVFDCDAGGPLDQQPTGSKFLPRHVEKNIYRQIFCAIMYAQAMSRACMPGHPHSENQGESVKDFQIFRPGLCLHCIHKLEMRDKAAQK